jgi:hypothetical protein
MKMDGLLWIALFLLPGCAVAQTNASGQFSCDPKLRAEFDYEHLRFDELTSADAIQQWKARTAVRFDGFDATTTGFTRLEFYRWHVPVPSREGYDQGAMSNSTDRLALAVHVVGPKVERWFEVANVEQESDESLFIQRWSLHDSDSSPSDTSPKEGVSSESDEMAGWLHLQFATPDTKMPLFHLVYQHDSSGVYQTETIDHHLLLDLRKGTPEIITVMTCKTFEPIGGACSAQDEAWEGHDTVECPWDAAATDFHCTLTTPYGSPHAARTAQSEFYLLSSKPVKPSAHHVEAFADVGQLALRIRDNHTTETNDAFVSNAYSQQFPSITLGSTTLLQRLKNVMPDSEIFVFASAGPGDMMNAHLSVVTLHGNDKPVIQSIPKWGIAGDQTDEFKRVFGKEEVVPLTANDLEDLSPYVPLAHDAYRTHTLEQRPGFIAFDVIVTAPQNDQNTPRIVYWVGLEAVSGKLIANAVRLAGDSSVYGGCGHEFLEATASLIRKKTGSAEATVRVQGQFQPEYSDPYPTEGPNCVWSGVLHWKMGAGFRVRKLGDNCKAPHQEIKISDDGEISVQGRPRFP